MGLILMLTIFTVKRLRLIPSRFQSIFEMLFKFLEEILTSTLGEKDGRKFLPFVGTLFIFILISNWIDIFPNFAKFFGVVIALIHKAIGGDVNLVYEGITKIMVTPVETSWYSFLFHLHKIEAPTGFLSTCLGLALIVFFVVHGFGLMNKGPLNYFRGYMEPLPDHGLWLVFFFLNPFFYLNVVGNIANTVSHSFRLFGNIFGGGITLVILSELVRFFLIPVGLYAFFGIFAGAIQAFVFTMLAIAYIAQQK